MRNIKMDNEFFIKLYPENHYPPTDIPQWSHGSCRCHSLWYLPTKNPEDTVKELSNYSLLSETCGLCIRTRMSIRGFSIFDRSIEETRETLRYYALRIVLTLPYFVWLVRLRKHDIFPSSNLTSTFCYLKWIKGTDFLYNWFVIIDIMNIRLTIIWCPLDDCRMLLVLSRGCQ